MNTRLNNKKDEKNWLSMRPNSKRWYSDWIGDGFGEVGNNYLHGRGICIDKYGHIFIGRMENDKWTGNYITIYSGGELQVGEI